MVRCCSYCKKICSNEKGRSAHVFPKNELLREKWMKACKFEAHHKNNYNNLKLCSDHFSKSCFRITSETYPKAFLKPDAVPTIFDCKKKIRSTLVDKSNTLQSSKIIKEEKIETSHQQHPVLVLSIINEDSSKVKRSNILLPSDKFNKVNINDILNQQQTVEELNHEKIPNAKRKLIKSSEPIPKIQVIQPKIQASQPKIQVSQPETQVFCPKKEIWEPRTTLQIPVEHLNTPEPIAKIQASQPKIQTCRSEAKASQATQSKIQASQPNVQTSQPEIQVSRPKRKIWGPRTALQMSIEHFDTPKRIALNLQLIRNDVAKKNKLINSLRLKNYRLKKKVDNQNKLIQHLQNKTPTSLVKITQDYLTFKVKRKTK